MRAGTRLIGWPDARADEGQHPLQGGWLPGFTIRWSELSPARGFATCGMGARSARSAADAAGRPSRGRPSPRGHRPEHAPLTRARGTPGRLTRPQNAPRTLVSVDHHDMARRGEVT